MPGDGQIGSSPDARGVTGLESWFWWDGTTNISWSQTGLQGIAADCSPLPAPVRTFTARIDHLEWDLAERTATSAPGGSEQQPAIRHVYNTKSQDYIVSVEIVWIGDPGRVTTPGGTKPHPVIEVRSVLLE